MGLSLTEENYLKAIFQIGEKTGGPVNTNAIAAVMNTAAASVTEMIKRLSDKQLCQYTPYRGVALTAEGRHVATQLVRRHRLWEVFLVEKLGFRWDEVHPIAEELEHIQAPELVQRLDAFLGHPTIDPHGDPIPDEDGVIDYQPLTLLAELAVGDAGVVGGVNEHSPAYLRHLEQLGLMLGATVHVLERYPYDHSVRLTVDGRELVVTEKVTRNLFIKKVVPS
jgi:DtxR family Mn-dependent transcriptional regulator